jgi:hypothetical protein
MRDTYDDARIVERMYPACRAAIETWVAVASAEGNILPFNISRKGHGDWGNFFPGPYGYTSDDYVQLWYILSLDRTAEFAAELGLAADVARYSGLAASARAAYLGKFWRADSRCFFDANCTYVNQLYGIYAGVLPTGGPDEAAAYAAGREWFRSGGAHAKFPEHFPGGIVSVRLFFGEGIADRFNDTSLALKMLLQTDAMPSIGKMVDEGATTLWEAYVPPDGMARGENSKDHIMFGGFGSWLFTSVAGLRRVGRGWARFELGPANGVALFAQLSSANASIDSPAGTVSVAWQARPDQAPDVTLNVLVPTGATASCSVPILLGGAELGDVTEGGNPVWHRGNFIPGMAGVLSGSASPAGDAVVFEIGSGSYSFTSSSPQ